MKYQIYSDNKVEGRWFQSLTEYLKNAEIIKIEGRGSNPGQIDEIISYDRPDIILVKNGSPVLVLEKTREVPTGHNIGQRMARIVRAVEFGIPTIKFLPFDARKHGDFSSVCNLNIRLIDSFKKMAEIHETPVLAINWPSNSHGELLTDGSENTQVSDVVENYLETKCDKNCIKIKEQKAEMDKEYAKRLTLYPKYAEMPGKSVYLINTKVYYKKINEDFAIDLKASGLDKKTNSLVYKIEMTPENCRREDPYTGTQFVYDYCWCRSGTKPEEKHSNLILHFPKITKDHWLEKNPNDSDRKSCNWYLTANALVFKDDFLVLR
jgi:hypothetical protein